MREAQQSLCQHFRNLEMLILHNLRKKELWASRDTPKRIDSHMVPIVAPSQTTTLTKKVPDRAACIMAFLWNREICFSDDFAFSIQNLLKNSCPFPNPNFTQGQNHFLNTISETSLCQMFLNLLYIAQLPFCCVFLVSIGHHLSD